jgi:chemotaxis signal transduction protein
MNNKRGVILTVVDFNDSLIMQKEKEKRTKRTRLHVRICNVAKL